MKSIQDKINFIKWQLEARIFGGSIYQRVRNSLINKNILDSDPFYYIYWLDLNKSLLSKYLFGTFGTSNEDYVKFINWLNERYAKEDIYEIEINKFLIKIPKPLIEDYKCFKAEFLDIIMPYLVQNIDMVQPFLEGPYEYGKVKIREGDTVLDLGANYGLFSSLAASRNCEVYAFEPTERVIKYYLSYLERLYPNVFVINKAVSNVTGTSWFKVYDNKSSCNSLQDNFINLENMVKVDTISVDDFVSCNNLNRVDFIKADIEGAERKMLDGAKYTLKEYAPNLAICYYHKLDDLKVLRKKILEANPNYEIDIAYKKIYAKVPGRD